TYRALANRERLRHIGRPAWRAHPGRVLPGRDRPGARSRAAAEDHRARAASGGARWRRVTTQRRLRGALGPADRRRTPAPPYATTGMSIGRDGENRSEDATLAARNALLNMIDYLGYERGLSRQQAYALASVAVDLKLSELVDVPNFVVSAFLPLDIFV